MKDSFCLWLVTADYPFIISQDTLLCKRFGKTFSDSYRGIFLQKLCMIHEITRSDKKSSLQNYNNVV